MKITNMYFAWWADSIIRIKTFNPKMQNWKMRVFILNTTLNALDYWIIIIWLKYLNILKIPLLTLDIFPGDVIDNVISAIINFATPFIILNYFLVFRKNRYEKIVLEYQDGNLNIAFPYAVISVFLAAITVLMYSLCW
jgi:hypothetical protein